MLTAADLSHPDREAGTYLPGRRLEVEPGGWDAEGRSGWGPGCHTGSGYHVVQRAETSPHPLLWVSSRFDTLAVAAAERLRLMMVEAVTAGTHPGFVIPGVVSRAFDRHLDAGHPGSLADEGDTGCCRAVLTELLAGSADLDDDTAAGVAALRAHFPDHLR